MNEKTTHYDAVIIGSGFGGSINALRIAQAGKSVLVLERGKRYSPGQFPRDVTDIDNLFWRYPKHVSSRGLFDIRFLSSIATVVSSGVGGGSLIYANIHIRPDPIIFDDPRWPAGINRESLNPYYDKVAAMLEVAPIPPEINLVKRDVYRNAAMQMGREVFDPDMAVKWNGEKDSLRDKCQLVAECEFGCQHGAKNTLDFTYLAKAEALGAVVEAGSYVTHVQPENGSYLIFYTDVSNGEEKSVTAQRVVFSAGTLGTNEILLKCRDVYRTLPSISNRLGFGYSGNGDFLGSIQNSKTDLRPWIGPDVTSVIKFFEYSPQFTMAAPTFNQAVMSVIASLGQSEMKGLRPFSNLLWPMLNWLAPLAFKKGWLSTPAKKPGHNAGHPANMTNLFAIGRDNANGRIFLRSGRIDIKWNYESENKQLIEKMKAAMQEVATIYGGTFSPLVTWNIFHRITTVHSLGGCHLSTSPDTGVVSTEGELHGYPGLFVADGSVIPTSIGFHPVMTISAVSERIAEAVVSSF